MVTATSQAQTCAQQRCTCISITAWRLTDDRDGTDAVAVTDTVGVTVAETVGVFERVTDSEIVCELVCEAVAEALFEPEYELVSVAVTDEV